MYKVYLMLSVVTVLNTFDPTLYGQIRDYVCHNTIVTIKKDVLINCQVSRFSLQNVKETISQKCEILF